MNVLRNIFFAVLVLILLICGGVFVFLKTFDLNKYLPQITDQASKALGRPVTIERVSLALSLQGIILETGAISIADDVQFSQEPFLKITKASLNVEVMPLLLQREIHVKSIVLDSPQIRVIRSPQGIINAQTIGQKPAAVSSDSAGTVKGSANGVTEVKPLKPSETPVSFPELMIKSVEISHASVVFIDKNPALPLNIPVSGIEILIENFSLTKPFHFTAAVPLSSNRPNIQIQSEVLLDMSQTLAHISNLKIISDLAQLNIDQLKTMTPVLATAPLPLQLAGHLEVNVAQLEASANGVSNIDAQVQLTDASVVMKDLLSPLSKIMVDAHIKGNDVQLNNFSGQMASGTITGQGEIKDYLKVQDFKIQSVLKDIHVEEMIDQKSAPVELKGKISGQINISGEGFGPDVLLKNIKGDGNLAMTDGVIEKLNILKMALGNTLGMIPGLAQQVDGLLTGVLKEKLGQDNTVLDKAQAKFTIKDAIFNLDEALISTQAFDINAQGTIDEHLDTKIQTMLRLDDDVTAALVKQVKEFSYLVDDSKKVSIPATVTGTIPNLKYTPQVDLKKFTQNAIVEEGTNQLQKVIAKNPQVGSILNAILGGGNANSQTPQDNTATSQEGSPSATPTPDEDTSKQNTKKALNNLLQNFMK